VVATTEPVFVLAIAAPGTAAMLSAAAKVTAAGIAIRRAAVLVVLMEPPYTPIRTRTVTP
jgi:hypothetical protein